MRRKKPPSARKLVHPRTLTCPRSWLSPQMKRAPYAAGPLKAESCRIESARNETQWRGGAEGRNRTSDTRIFGPRYGHYCLRISTNCSRTSILCVTVNQGSFTTERHKNDTADCPGPAYLFFPEPLCHGDAEHATTNARSGLWTFRSRVEGSPKRSSLIRLPDSLTISVLSARP
jgi:hypothetical protein